MWTVYIQNVRLPVHSSFFPRPFPLGFQVPWSPWILPLVFQINKIWVFSESGHLPGAKWSLPKACKVTQAFYDLLRDLIFQGYFSLLLLHWCIHIILFYIPCNVWSCLWRESWSHKRNSAITKRRSCQGFRCFPFPEEPAFLFIWL